MFSEKKDENSAPNQWALINRNLIVYKVAVISLALVLLVMTALEIYHTTASPLVVVRECDEKYFYEGKREKLNVTDSDIRSFVEKWIHLRYSLGESNLEKTLYSVSPLSTSGFLEKLRTNLSKKNAARPKDQKLEENIANIKVDVTDKDIMASFDRIIRINQIPIVVPSEISLHVVQGSSTRWNPLGLYVNGVIEHEER